MALHYFLYLVVTSNLLLSLSLILEKMEAERIHAHKKMLKFLENIMRKQCLKNLILAGELEGKRSAKHNE